jgi:hypothetical protein
VWCATGKFSKFEIFEEKNSANSKMFENFPADSKKLAVNLPVVHGLCGALRVNFKILKILPLIQKCLKIFPSIQKNWRETYP